MRYELRFTRYELRFTIYEDNLRGTIYEVRITISEIRCAMCDVRCAIYDLRGMIYDLRGTRYDCGSFGFRFQIYELRLGYSIHYSQIPKIRKSPFITSPIVNRTSSIINPYLYIFSLNYHKSFTFAAQQIKKIL